MYQNQNIVNLQREIEQLEHQLINNYKYVEVCYNGDDDSWSEEAPLDALDRVQLEIRITNLKMELSLYDNQ